LTHLPITLGTAIQIDAVHFPVGMKVHAGRVPREEPGTTVPLNGVVMRQVWPIMKQGRARGSFVQANRQCGFGAVRMVIVEAPPPSATG